MNIDAYRERNRTRQQIRQGGAIANLNDGIEIEIHGVLTRLIAWPGNGFQTQSVHVLTLAPGVESERYTYDMAEEAMICLKGGGEVFLRGRWVDIVPGDIVFYPERTPRAMRNPASNDRDFVLVTQIAPPEFGLYAPAGFYDQTKGVMVDDALEAAKARATSDQLSPENEMRLSESHPELRAWNLSVDEIRRDGALFNAYKGAAFGGLDVPMVLVLWPGYGVRSTGFHFGRMDAGQVAHLHSHPVSDEAVINWSAAATSTSTAPGCRPARSMSRSPPAAWCTAVGCRPTPASPSSRAGSPRRRNSTSTSTRRSTTTGRSTRRPGARSTRRQPPAVMAEAMRHRSTRRV